MRYSASSVGADSFKFKASDGNSDSNVATVTTNNVPAVNDPPQCSAPPQLQVEVGEPANFAGNASTKRATTLTITITEQPTKGTAEVVDQGTPIASVRYSASSVGADSFKFKASDGNSDSNEATVTTNNVPAVNDPPSAPACQQAQVEVGEPADAMSPASTTRATT